MADPEIDQSSAPVAPEAPPVAPQADVALGNSMYPPLPQQQPPPVAQPPTLGAEDVPMKDAMGHVVMVPANLVGPQALKGFVQSTPEDFQQQQNQEKYGTPGQTVAGLGEEFAAGATASVSKLIETKMLGIDPKDIAGRAAALGPLNRFLAGGLGFGLTSALTAGLGAEPLAAALGEGIGAKVSAGVATMAAYDAAQQVSEHEIGDAPFNAEASLMQLGISAAIGGAAGGLGGLVGQAIPEAVRKVGDAMGSIDDIAQRTLTKGLVLGGAPQDVVEASLKLSQEAAAAKMSIGEYLKSSAAKGRNDLSDAYEKMWNWAVNQKNAESLARKWGEARMSAIEGAVKGRGDVPQFADGLASDVDGELAKAYSDPGKYGFRANTPEEGSGWSNQPPQFISKIHAFLGDFRKAVDRAIDVEPGDQAFHVWKAADDFSTNMDTLIKWGKESPSEMGGNLQNLAKGIRATIDDFTKDTEVFGDKIRPLWDDTQAAYKRVIDASDEALKSDNFGRGPRGDKMFSREAFEKALRAEAKEQALTGQPSYKARVMDELTSSIRDFSSKVGEAMQTIPEKNFDTEGLNAGLDSLDDIKKQTLAKYGLSDAFGRLQGGKKISLGGLWVPAAVMSHFGLPAPVLKFVLGAWEGGRLLTNPKATIEAYGRLANMVAKTRGLIGSSAKGAAKALVDPAYGMQSSWSSGLSGKFEQAVKASILGARAVSDMHEGSQRHGQDLATAMADPETLGANLGNAWSGMPPDTAAAGTTATANQLKVRQSIQPPPGSTASDEIVHGSLLHAIENPVSPLDDLAAGRHDPKRQAVAALASPAISREAQAALLHELAQLDTSKMNPYAKAALASFQGGQAWPDGTAEAAQAAYASVSQPGSPGLPGGKSLGAKARNSKTKFKLNQSRLPIDRTERPD